jgi:hypothetical protein
MEKSSGTLNKTPNTVLMPLTGSKNRFFAPNGNRNGAGQRQFGRFHTPVRAGSCLNIPNLSI